MKKYIIFARFVYVIKIEKRKTSNRESNIIVEGFE